MPRRHPKRFAATKGKSKSSNNGLVTGGFPRLFIRTAESADDIPQVWEFESQFQEAGQKWDEQLPRSDDHGSTGHRQNN